MLGPTTSATVHVVEYDANWPRIFEEIRSGVWPSIRDVATTIEHVGSTSVPGLAAKPVIDIDVVVPSRSHATLVRMRLEALGYRWRGDLGIEDREAFTPPENGPAHHLYACIQSSLALKNHIAVRDYLRSHPEEIAIYSDLKKQFAERFRTERGRYGEAKTEFILSILKQCGFSAEELDSIRRANQTSPC